MRIEDGYLLGAWQYDKEDNKIYPYLLTKLRASEQTFDVSLTGKSFPGSYAGVKVDDFIEGLRNQTFPYPATVRMKPLNVKGSGNAWLIRNLRLDSSFNDGGDFGLPSPTVRLNDVKSEFEDLLHNSRFLSDEELEKKSREFPDQPIKLAVTSFVYQRNPYVVLRALQRANGVCEHCFSAAPFIRNSDGSPYLEVHHKIPLAQGGKDTFENTVALCPNCHRLMHFGPIA
ncbi:HNH endonuclease signature motif containing protein [Pseudomonas sp. A-B-19]|uniref:HNH endonuclease n=1 Tax=Pseudomonas sp. A-B-19 TaxID=2832405 RepID=UPI001CC195B7|nr:HNH endonuclease signature motif containing protein [Pseudomonas sp. A-B-19]